jgi:hypothetical protein
MIGFIVSPETAAAVNEAVANAQTSRGLDVYWLPGAFPILRGEHAGKCFVPGDDDLFDTPLRGDPPLTPRDFPEFTQLISALGGVDARIEIESHVIGPDAES